MKRTFGRLSEELTREYGCWSFGTSKPPCNGSTKLYTSRNSMSYPLPNYARKNDKCNAIWSSTSNHVKLLHMYTDNTESNITKLYEEPKNLK